MSRRSKTTLVILFASAAIASCGDDSTNPELPVEEQPAAWTDCQADSAAFVRRSFQAVLGRNMWSQADARAWTATYEAIRSGAVDDVEAREQLVNLLAADPAYSERWGQFFLDALQVPRSLLVRDNGYDRVEVPSCYGDLPTPFDDGELAVYVRDNSPSESSPPRPRFTLGQLLVSSLQLDDLSVPYRAHLFHLLRFPLAGANVEPLDLERNRRLHAATQFGDVYIHRDVQCLGCHNSEFSVTYSDQADLNRAWPVPGNFERALFGTSGATEREPLEYFSAFRFVDVIESGRPPWGWDDLKCGEFDAPSAVDPLDIDSFFGSVHSSAADPLRGKKASVWLLESAFRRGVDTLAADGLNLGPDGAVDPDEAFVYLTAKNVVEQVWEEIIGTKLTITNYFPRTQLQAETLRALTDSFVKSRFSLRRLLADILGHPAFNLQSPANWCREDPYDIPRFFDPWTDSEPDARLKANSAADRVAFQSPRTLLLSLHTALEWPPPADFPPEEEVDFHRSIGVFISSDEPGARGLDLQRRLSWEARFASCALQGERDFISDLSASAVATGATFREALVALKDRLHGDPEIGDPEAAALEAVTGSPLDAVSSTSTDAQLRLACGVFISSAQFLLQGLEPPPPTDDPLLTPPSRGFDASCLNIGTQLTAAGLDPSLACAEAE